MMSDDQLAAIEARCKPIIRKSRYWVSSPDFIAHARADIPALVAEVRRLREANAAYRNSLAMTSVFTKLDIFKAMGDNGPKAQSMIHEDMKLAWGLDAVESEGADGN